MTTVFIEPDGLLYRTGPVTVIPASSLSEVCVGWFPPTVRTRAGAYHFVPALTMVELADMAVANGVPFVARDDVWSWILEPFLDTALEPAHDARLLAALERRGMGRDEVLALRARLEARMLAYTAVTWEWQHYGLHDVLTVMGEGFKARAFAIADRGLTQPSTREAFLRFAPPAARSLPLR